MFSRPGSTDLINYALPDNYFICSLMMAINKMTDRAISRLGEAQHATHEENAEKLRPNATSTVSRGRRQRINEAT